MVDARKVAHLLKKNIGQVIIGKPEAVEYALIALICRGHVLIEDVPGVGKTTLASALSRSMSCSFQRIQFTPDVTPSDITGFSVANLKTGEMDFRQGLIMSQFILADEINRTSPKTQSSLLEAMEEGQVTVDGVTYAMAQPFIVLATQNPTDFVGTYPLPEAQLDRFFLRITIGYPTQEEEIDILARYTMKDAPLKSLQPICSAEEILALQEQLTDIYCAKEIRAYVASLCAASRRHPALKLGISTRGGIYLLRAAQACAMLDGRDFVLPEDVQHMVAPVLAHRVLIAPEARMKGVSCERTLSAIVGSVPVPVKVK